MRRVGILGGAFNPPHIGHLRLAEIAVETLNLAEVRFIPTAISPHKPTDGPSGEMRLALLRLALEAAGGPYVADPVEISRGGVSYTADTLEELSEREPGTSWILVVGSDQLPGLATWRKLSRILELASLAIAPRPGCDWNLPAGMAERHRDTWSGAPGEVIFLPATLTDLASSTLRDQIQQGEQIDGVPTQVRDAILRQNLYR